MPPRTRRKKRVRAKRSSNAQGPVAHILKNLFRKEVTPNRSDDAAARPAKSGSAVLKKEVKGWRVAKSLDRLLDQVNQLAPNRKKASDGSIGDTDHQKRDSDHNPWVIDGNVGVVTARDITHDPKNGCDAQAIADAIVSSKDKRVKYIIWNRKICNSKVSPWKWRPYGGTNPHTKHIHISVLPQKSKYDDESDWNLTEVAVANVQSEFEVPKIDDMELAWGKKVSKDFKEKVVTISARLGVDPNHLMAAMAFESGRSFRPNIQNPYSKATGLIQFMPTTAKSLGTSIEALKRMSAVRQLDFVEKYFSPYIGRLKDLDDLYMAILWPRAVAKPASYVLFAAPTKAYKFNKGLDTNVDGAVTKAEAAMRVREHLVEGMREGLRG
jgi:transglycosylase-like protein with SLT domain